MIYHLNIVLGFATVLPNGSEAVVETVGDQLARVRSLAPHLRAQLAHAGVELDEPDQVLHALLVLCANEILRIAHEQALDLDDAVQAGAFAGRQLPRLVRQLSYLRS